MFQTKRVAALVTGMMLLSSVADAYYFFVHYPSRTGNFNPIVERFDLNGLPEKTVTFLISDQGPTKYAEGDNYQSLVSQIRAAANVWNTVDTSDLRVRFGGFLNNTVQQNTPGIDVIFDDLEPGVFGRGGPIVRGDQVNSTAGNFIPILRSQVILRKDLSLRPSWSEGFFQTAVHELGHALGLQHSMSAGAMSQDSQRTTTKSKPLTSDDIAGISTLYPTRGVKDSFGSIAGRVTLNGAGVPLANVTAIVAKGPAVSSYTNPDGTYRIDGLPGGQAYYLYVSPLPPTIGLVLPKDNLNREFDAGPTFDSVFFLGSKTPISTTAVTAGQTENSWNFSVQRRPAITLYDVLTYSYPGQLFIRPAHLNIAGNRYTSYALGEGIMQNGQPAPGLQLSMLGEDLTPTNLRAATADYLQVDWSAKQLVTDGPEHLIFTKNGELYVLPNGLHIVSRQPPSVTSLTAGQDASGAQIVTVVGSSLTIDTRILFDGQAGINKSIDDQGRLVVAVPAGQSGHRASVTAANPDGQSSLFVQSPVTFIFEGAENTAISAPNTSLPSGSESVIEVTGINTTFADGQTTVGFSSTDLFVKRIWVVNGNRLLVNVAVAPNTLPGTYSMRVSTGLRTLTQSQGITVVGSNPRQLSIAVPSNVQAYQPGSTGSLNVVNLPDSSGIPTLFINNQQIAGVAVLGGSISFPIPANLPIGPALARLQNNGESSQPIVLNVAPLTQITSVIAGPGILVDSNRPARLGELLGMFVTGLPDNFGTPKQIVITIAGIEHKPVSATSFGSAVQLQFFLKSEVVNGLQPMTVTLDSLTTPVYNLPVQK